MRYLLTTLLSFSLLASAMADLSPDFVVAPNGNDSHVGTADKPFASITKAQESVRVRIAEGEDKHIVVALRGGRYNLNKTLTFTPEDGGNKNVRVTYVAWPDEIPVLSGGRIIKNWRKKDKNQWVTTVDNSWVFRQLFKDKQRLERGRFPNGSDLLHLTQVSNEATSLSVDKPIPVKNLGEQNAELVVLQNWSITRGLIASSLKESITTRTNMGWIGHPWTTASRGKPCYLENALDFVDVPGEWYLDYETAVLTYQAAEDENPNDHEFITPQVEQLLLVEGTREHQVENLHFTGLHFEYAEWKLPEIGYRGLQAAHYGTRLKERMYPMPGGIEFSYASNCSVEKSVISRFGPSGIVFGPRTLNNSVTGCIIKDVGSNGIMVGWRMKAELGPPDRHPGNHLDSDWQDKKDVPTKNQIVGNTVRNCGAINFGAVGIYDAYCEATRIAHNHVYDMPYTGISIGFRWSTVPCSQRDTLVEYNHVHTVMTKLADGGCLYTLGLQPGTLIHGNVFHDAQRSTFAHGGAPNNGIFFDEGSKGMLIKGNTIYDCSGGPIRFHATNKENMTWEDNSFGVGLSYRNMP